MIEIKNVSFFYQGNEQLNAVENLSLVIPKGQIVVLCGEYGKCVPKSAFSVF